MTDTSAIQTFGPKETTAFTPTTGPLITESYWGFSVRNTQHAPLSFYVTQGLSLCIGAGFLAAAVGLLVLPGAAIQSDTLAMRLGLCTAFTIIAWLLITYANRGVTSELQIDSNMCEVREVLKNRLSKSSLIGQFGFDTFTGVTINHDTNCPQNVDLYLNSRDPSQLVFVARGTQAQIDALHGRITRDMMIGTAPRTYDTVTPLAIR